MSELSQNMKLICVCLALLVGVGCVQNTDDGRASSTDTDAEKHKKIGEMYDGYRSSFPGIAEITAKELGPMMREGSVILVDVREAKERAVSVLPGSISKGDFEAIVDDLDGKKIVVYCTIGYRSGEYVEALKSRGIEAFNLQGSILSWVHAGEVVVTLDGSETKRVHVYGEKWNLLPQGFEAVW